MGHFCGGKLEIPSQKPRTGYPGKISSRGLNIIKDVLESNPQTIARFLKDSNSKLFGETLIHTILLHVLELCFINHSSKAQREIARLPFALNVIPGVRRTGSQCSNQMRLHLMLQLLGKGRKPVCKTGEVLKREGTYVFFPHCSMESN